MFFKSTNPGGDELFLPFKDKTAEGLGSKGAIFSLNPASGKSSSISTEPITSCAYGEKYTCPDPPQENWLNTEIRAGEKRFR
jgi:uncharacterized protein (DUF1684 family)